jgi:hypothetical protein
MVTMLIELAKTMDIETIAKRTGRKPLAVLKMATRLGISLKSTEGEVKGLICLKIHPFRGASARLGGRAHFLHPTIGGFGRALVVTKECSE